MRLGLITFLILIFALPGVAQEGDESALEIYGNACEKIISGESKSSTRVRAVDKATFLGVKKLDIFTQPKKILNDHDMNVMVYRLVDEYVEDLSAKILKDDEGKVCVEIQGWISSQAIDEVSREFIQDDLPVREASADVVAQAAREVKEELVIKPDNPENLALVYIGNLEFFNGAQSTKYAQELKKQFADNPYFYLTDDAEIADYIVSPKVLKAKVDNLDAGNKRLQMVVNLEITGIENDTTGAYQNRFVLFGAEEDEQKTAARLVKKLLENAGDTILRKIERNEQHKLEQKTIGRPLS